MTTTNQLIANKPRYRSCCRTFCRAATGLYKIRQIEDALHGEINWNTWKNKIYNSYSNETKANLSDSFDFWNSY